MKYVSLLRHAKSSWADRDQQDFDRPLNERGREAAALIGANMTKIHLSPDIVLCSSARRTRETLKLVLDDRARPKKTHVVDALYLASPATLLAQINALPDEFGHVLVIGHNPGLETLAMDLADRDRSDEPALKRLAGKFPTGALARFEFDVAEWARVAPGAGRLAAFVTPRDLEAR